MISMVKTQKTKYFFLSGICAAIAIVGISGCQNNAKTFKTVGQIEILDQAGLHFLDESAKIEVLAEGFEWSEGPVWIDEGEYVLFSDIPNNRVHKWSEKDGLSTYLDPAGYTGETPRGGELGSNGLLIGPDGKLVLCQHGDRRLAKMISELNDPKPEYRSMVTEYNGNRLNSPNDAVFSSNGDLYFTDPPYGLENRMEDSLKELTFQGVYLFKTTGELILLTDTLPRPNGIVLSPDEQKLYVAVSHEPAVWMVYDVLSDKTISNGQIFYNATDLLGVEGEQGLPDGMVMHSSGHIFATGPGGVWVFDPKGKPLAKVRTGEVTANCALSSDEKTLYITADMYLLRVALK